MFREEQVKVLETIEEIKRDQKDMLKTLKDIKTLIGPAKARPTVKGKAAK